MTAQSEAVFQELRTKRFILLSPRSSWEASSLCIAEEIGRTTTKQNRYALILWSCMLPYHASAQERATFPNAIAMSGRSDRRLEEVQRPTDFAVAFLGRGKVQYLLY
jgi:hypothetical protein